MIIRKSLFFILLIGATGSLLSGCDGAEERKAKYMVQAEESFAIKDYDKAKLGYKNAIQIDPKDISARIGLAKVSVAEQDWRAAAAQYKSVLDIDSENNEAAVELGKLYLLARAQDLAFDEAEKVLARDPNNTDALILKAGILAQQGEIIPALTILEGVYEKDKSNTDGVLLYASMLATSLEYEKAISILNEALETYSDNLDLHSVLVNVYKSAEQHDDALRTLEKIIEIRPQDFVHKQRLVSYYLNLRKVDEAEAKLQSYVDADPESLEARKSLVDLIMAKKDVEKAETLLKQYIAEFPKEYDFQLGLARIHLIQEDQAKAIAVFDQIIEADPQGPSAASANFQKAQLFAAQNELEKAKVLLEEIITLHPDHTESLMLRANIALGENRTVDALNDYRSVLKNDPDDARVTRALASTHYQAGEYRLAENYYKQLVRRFPNDLVSRNGLALVYASLGKQDESIKLREEIRASQPKNFANLIELAKLYATSGNIDRLKQTAVSMMENEQSKASGKYFNGLAYQMERNHEVAIKEFDESLKITSNAVEPVSAKVKSLLSLERFDEAESWLKSRVAGEEKNALSYNLLGEVALLSKKYKEANSSFDSAIELGAKWPVPYRNKAISYKAQGNSDKAIATLKQGIGAVNDANGLRLELAQLLEANNDVDGAIEQYEILNSGENAPQFAANNLAMLLVTYKDDQESLDKATKVAEALRGSSNPMFLDTLGWVYYKQNQVDLALPLIKEAASKAPDVAQINFHLAKAYHSKANTASAIQYLEKALNSDQVFVGRKEAQALLDELTSKQG